jgi:hypothetical protein
VIDAAHRGDRFRVIPAERGPCIGRPAGARCHADERKDLRRQGVGRRVKQRVRALVDDTRRTRDLRQDRSVQGEREGAERGPRRADNRHRRKGQRLNRDAESFGVVEIGDGLRDPADGGTVGVDRHRADVSLFAEP